MLRELSSARQVPGEPKRRWFSSARCDLIVWVRDDDSADGFQFCYDKDTREHALTWTQGRGFSHTAVDPGDSPARHKGTPILVADGAFDANRILEIFQAEAQSLPPEYATLISRKLRQLAEEPGEV